jgi:hypothetical protein
MASVQRYRHTTKLTGDSSNLYVKINGGSKLMVKVGDYILHPDGTKEYQHIRQMVNNLLPLNSVEFNKDMSFVLNNTEPDTAFKNGLAKNTDNTQCCSNLNQIDNWPIKPINQSQSMMIIKSIGTQNEKERAEVSLAPPNTTAINLTNGEPIEKLSFFPETSLGTIGDELNTLGVKYLQIPNESINTETYKQQLSCSHNLINADNWIEVKSIMKDVDDQLTKSVICNKCLGEICCIHVMYEHTNTPFNKWTILKNKNRYCSTCGLFISPQGIGRNVSIYDIYSPVVTKTFHLTTFTLSQILSNHCRLSKYITDNHAEHFYNLIAMKLTQSSSLNVSGDLLLRVFVIYYIILFGIIYLTEKETGELKIKNNGNTDEPSLRDIEFEEVRLSVNTAFKLYVTNFLSLNQYDQNNTVRTLFYEALAFVKDYINQNKNIKYGPEIKTFAQNEKMHMDLTINSFDLVSVISDKTGLSEQGVLASNNMVNPNLINEVFERQALELKFKRVELKKSNKHTPVSLHVLGFNGKCSPHNWNFALKDPQCTMCDVLFSEESVKDDSDIINLEENKHLTRHLLIYFSTHCFHTNSNGVKYIHTQDGICKICNYPKINDEFINKYGHVLFNIIEPQPNTNPSPMVYDNSLAIDQLPLKKNDKILDKYRQKLPSMSDDLVLLSLKFILRTIYMGSPLNIDLIKTTKDFYDFVTENKINASVILPMCLTWGRQRPINTELSGELDTIQEFDDDTVELFADLDMDQFIEIEALEMGDNGFD